MSREEFERVVRDTLDDLPPAFQDLLENVVVVVEEEPDPADLAALGMDPDDELLGLYQGTSLLERGHDHWGLPDKVAIYRGPILRIADSLDAVRQEIRETVIHELGHHFGLDDDGMAY